MQQGHDERAPVYGPVAPVLQPGYTYTTITDKISAIKNRLTTIENERATAEVFERVETPSLLNAPQPLPILEPPRHPGIPW